MKINNSISLSIGRNIQQSTSAISRSLERLSTGKRINSPVDDIAGFATIQTLSSQIRGLRQASLNINAGVGMIQTATAALSSQNDILQRIREIAVQASSSTLSSNERSSISNELDSLMEEFRRITAETEFNSMKLLNGELDSLSLQIGAEYDSQLEIGLESFKASDVFRKDVGAGSFQSATTVSVGDFPDDVNLADLDGDGNLDMVSVDDGTSHTISVRLGNGDGTFGARTTVAAGNTPIQIEVGDITGDGVLDLVVLDDTSNTIDLYEGRGDGTFSSRITFAITEASQSGFSIDDMNGDGHLDLVVGNNTTSISVLLNNGVGSLNSAVTFATAEISNSIFTADFDGDGDLDVLVGNSSETYAEVLLNNGSSTSYTSQGSIAATAIFSGPASFSILDLNDDGAMDFIMNDTGSNNISIYLNSGSATFTGSTYSSGSTMSEYVVGDFNNDGTADLLGRSAVAWSLLYGNGSGSFTAGSTGSLTSSNGLAAGDLNSDGVLDFIAANSASDLVSIMIQNTENQSAESDVDVSSTERAQALIGIVDEAIERIVSGQTELSVALSRLENIQSYNLLQSENLAEAKASIEEADIALETSELVRNQILQQAQISSLAQANVQMQVILGLFNY